jgi:TRAP-type C4-dicarboxylate transport system substrate-binding protein
MSRARTPSLLRTIAPLAVVCLVTIVPSLTRAAPRRVATLAPTGSPWMNVLERGAQKLRKETQGRVDIRFYSGGIQGDEVDVVRKMKLKQLDGAALTVVGLSSIYSGIRILQLPLIFSSEKEVIYVRKKMWNHFRTKFGERGYYLQDPGGAGWELFYTNRAVNSLADLRTVTMWEWAGDTVVRTFFGELGVKTVPLSVPNLLGALKTGRITGCYGPPMAAVALQWTNEITHAGTLQFAYTIGSSVVRQEVWDKLTESDKKLELKVGRQMGKYLGRRVGKDNQRGLQAMKRAGVRVVNTPTAVRTQLEKAAEKVWHQLAGTIYSKEELDMLLRYRAEFRAKTR